MHVTHLIILWLICACAAAQDSFFENLDLANTDATPTIQRVIDRTGECKLPRRKRLLIDGTIFVSHEKTLDLNEATLVRKSKNDAPLIHVTGNFAEVDGPGWLLSMTPNPRGMIHVGPKDPKEFTNINWVNVRRVRMEYQGSSSPDSVGIDLSSSEPQVKGSNYNNTFVDNYVSKVAIGVRVGKECNAQEFRGTHFYKIGRYCYQSIDNSENTFMGGFTHLSPGILAIIKLESAAYNLFYAVQGEPGGARSRYFYVDAGCINCQILGHDNCSAGPVDLGFQTTYLSHGHLRAKKVTVSE